MVFKYFFVFIKWLFLAAVIVVAVVAYIFFFSPGARNGMKNYETATKVRTGMGRDQVIQIMGLPDKRFIFYHTTDSAYWYQPPVTASEGINIIFDSSLLVRHIDATK